MRTTRLRALRRAVYLLSAALLALLSFNVAFAGWGVPDAITDEGRKIEDLYYLVTVMAFIVFFAVEGALIVILVRYRRRTTDEALPAQTHGNNVLEIIWTAIPIVIVLILFAFSFVVLQDVEHGSKPESLTVGVEGFQFSWAFTYTQNDLGTVNNPNAEGDFTVRGTGEEDPTLVIPVGEPVEFTLLSNDVIHSFYIRDFLYKLDVIPGRDNKFTVTARVTGTYDAQCAELCGLNHALMRFHLRVVSRAEFDAWVAERTAEEQNAAREP